MQLPFTKEQFFGLLAAYSAGLWPDRWISALLAALKAEAERRTRQTSEFDMASK